MENDIKAILERLESLVSLAPFWEKHPKALIYGAGNVGKDVFRILTERGIPVIGFLDRKAQPGYDWNGVPILQPDDEQISTGERRQVSVVIAIHNRDADIPPIIQKLEICGYTHIVTLIELFDYLSHALGNRYWLTARSYYRSLGPIIQCGGSLWADEASRALYAAILRFRITGDYAILPKPDQEHQYFSPDIPAYKTPLRFVDCGAFDGDTLTGLIEAEVPIEAIAAFEPDPENFGKLARFVNANDNKLGGNVELWPCGVYSSTTQLSFASGKGEAGQLLPEGNAMIQRVALDEVIPRFRPSLIKMDIESAEYDALLGARQIIKQDHPALAICVYHRPAHIWQIPMLIQSWNCGYRFYLRSHGFNGFDLVMYAIPE